MLIKLSRVREGTIRLGLSLGLFLAAWVWRPRNVRADIAPPEQAPGSSLAPGQGATQVVMDKENVVLVVQSNAWSGTFTPLDVQRGLTRDWAQVRAHFSMRNAGEFSETMGVRFPLSSPQDQRPLANEIQDLGVQVDGLTVTTRRIEGPSGFSGVSQGSTIGWAVFDVTFPPGREVKIDVTYSLRATGYDGQESRLVYVLGTGAGWNDAIGRADITVRLPYPASIENLVDYDPGWVTPGYELVGSEIGWSYADLEPEAGQVVTATLVAVDLWRAVVKAEPAVIARAQEGAAWGALARATKIALCTEKGYWPRQDAGGRHLAERSLAAYEKATALAPEVARWHAGYAELLARLMTRRDADDPMLQLAIVQVNAALELEPTNAQALQVVEDLRGRASIALEHSASGARVVRVTSTPTVSVPPPVASNTLAASRTATRETATREPTSATSAPARAPASGRGGGCFSVAAPLLVVFSRPRRLAAGGRAPSAH